MVQHALRFRTVNLTHGDLHGRGRSLGIAFLDRLLSVILDRAAGRKPGLAMKKRCDHGVSRQCGVRILPRQRARARDVYRTFPLLYIILLLSQPNA